jgi:hypothetical protein
MSGTFSGNAAISITAPGCQVQNLCIFGNSITPTSNPVGNGIEITGAKFTNLQNLFMQSLNGWCIESVATASTACLGTSIYNVTGYNSAGGIHIQGVAGTSFIGQTSLIDCQLSQIGVSSGANANLDVIKLEDVSDILLSNTNCAVSSATTGSTLHIKGLCSGIFASTTDIGVFPTAGTVNSVILIEDSANGSPSLVQFTNGVAQAGQVACTITGGASQVTFAAYTFKNSLTHNVVLSGSGFQVQFASCIFSVGGQGATGTNYDLSISGTVTGFVTGSRFNSPVVSSGTIGVQGVVNVGTSGQNVQFTGNAFAGAGTTVGNAFTTNLPSVARQNVGYNPHGTISVAVPATTVATTALHYDAMFYITAGATSCTITRNVAGGGGSGPTVTIPANACVPVWVPAQSSITPVYTNAPTWLVDGQ